MVSFKSICFITAKHLYCILTIVVSIRYSYGSMDVLTDQNKVFCPNTKGKVVQGVALRLSYKHRCIYSQVLFCLIIYIRTEYKQFVRGGAFMATMFLAVYIIQVTSTAVLSDPKTHQHMAQIMLSVDIPYATSSSDTHGVQSHQNIVTTWTTMEYTDLYPLCLLLEINLYLLFTADSRNRSNETYKL